MHNLCAKLMTASKTLVVLQLFHAIFTTNMCLTLVTIFRQSQDATFFYFHSSQCETTYKSWSFQSCEVYLYLAEKNVSQAGWLDIPISINKLDRDVSKQNHSSSYRVRQIRFWMLRYMWMLNTFFFVWKSFCSDSYE
jgi:hypothetical protein